MRESNSSTRRNACIQAEETSMTTRRRTQAARTLASQRAWATAPIAHDITRSLY